MRQHEARKIARFTVFQLFEGFLRVEEKKGRNSKECKNKIKLYFFNVEVR